jgi:hypothetical protein
MDLERTQAWPAVASAGALGYGSTESRKGAAHAQP